MFNDATSTAEHVRKQTRKPVSDEAKKKAAERKEKMRLLAAQVSKLSEAQRFEMAAKYPVLTIEGRALSIYNACMVATQLPSSTVVGGFRQWLAAGRAVRKGEKGLGIWIPCGSSKASEEMPNAEANDGETADRCYFTMGTVFDISQTQEIEQGAREEVKEVA